jgi:alpha-1,2-mannosyltransferase
MTNAYPPFWAFCFIPFAIFPFRAALLLFTAISMLALAIGVWAFFADQDPNIRRHLTVAGLLITFSFFPVYDSLYMGQVNALLFLFLALVIYFARRDRPWHAGFFIALAALIKIFPAVLILFFAAKRQFKPVVAALLSMFILVAASLPVCGLGLYINYVSKVVPGQTDGGAFYRNQGFSGFFARLLTDNAYVHSLGNWPVLAHVLSTASGVLVLAAALWVAARRAGHYRVGKLEFGLCLTATLLALPKSWEHYSVLLLFAYLAIFRILQDTREVPRAATLLTFLSFCVWTFLLPTGVDYARLPHSILMQPLFSVKCVATLMLFVACVWLALAQTAKENAPSALVSTRSAPASHIETTAFAGPS